MDGANDDIFKEFKGEVVVSRGGGESGVGLLAKHSQHAPLESLVPCGPQTDPEECVEEGGAPFYPWMMPCFESADKKPQFTLENILERWAAKHWVECQKSIAAKPADRSWRKRCLAAVFRRLAAASPRWFVMWCEWQGGQVLRLSPWIGKVKLPDGDFPPEGETWPDAVAHVALVELFLWTCRKEKRRG